MAKKNTKSMQKNLAGKFVKNGRKNLSKFVKNIAKRYDPEGNREHDSRVDTKIFCVKKKPAFYLINWKTFSTHPRINKNGTA